MSLTCVLRIELCDLTVDGPFLFLFFNGIDDMGSFPLTKMQARPSLERGKVEDILDVSLLSEPCNMKMMLKMGQLGLRCVVNTPKLRPTMTQVWQELQEDLYLAENFIHKQPSWDSRKSVDYEYSQSSFVSINGVGFQRFHVEMESPSFRSTVLRCLENNSISHVDGEKTSLKGINDEKSREFFC